MKVLLHGTTKKIYYFSKKDLTYCQFADIIVESLGEVAELVEGAALEML